MPLQAQHAALKPVGGAAEAVAAGGVRAVLQQQRGVLRVVVSHKLLQGWCGAGCRLRGSASWEAWAGQRPSRAGAVQRRRSREGATEPVGRLADLERGIGRQLLQRLRGEALGRLGAPHAVVLGCSRAGPGKSGAVSRGRASTVGQRAPEAHEQRREAAAARACLVQRLAGLRAAQQVPHAQEAQHVGERASAQVEQAGARGVASVGCVHWRRRGAAAVELGPWRGATISCVYVRCCDCASCGLGRRSSVRESQA